MPLSGLGPTRHGGVVPDREKLSVQVSAECGEEARDAVIFLRTQGIHTTLSGFVEKAIKAEIERLRKTYNEGQRLPRRKTELGPGRPLS